MPSQYTDSSRFTKQGIGENDNTWGIIANTQYDLIDDAVNGVLTLNVTTGSNITLTANNGTQDEARNKILKLTGTPTANIQIIVPAVHKEYIVDAQFTGANTVTITPTGGGAGISFTAGQRGIVYCDGVNITEILKSLTLGALATKNTVATSDIDDSAVTSAKIADNTIVFGDIQQITNMKLLGNVSGATDNVAEVTVSTDATLASNSDSIIPTQKAVKGYTDNNPATIKAAVTFTNTGTIIGGFGVSSVTKVSTGVYDINLSASFANKNKMVVQCGNTNGSGTTYNIFTRWDITSTTTSKVRIRSMLQEDNGYGIINTPADDSYYTMTLTGDAA